MNQKRIKDWQIIMAFALMICMTSAADMSFAGSISGTVYYNGGVFSGADVYYYANGFWNYTFADENGDYYFTDLPDGDYYVSIYYQDQMIEGDLYYAIPAGKQVGTHIPTYSTFCWENATVVSVRNGADISNINILIDLTGKLAGYVYNEDDESPVRDVKVWAWSEVICYSNWTVTNSEGYFELTDLYQVNTSDGPLAGYALYSEKDNFINMFKPNIGTGMTQIGLPMTSSGTLHVFVYDGALIPVTTAVVSLWSAKAGFMGVRGTHIGEGMYEFYKCPPVSDYIFSVSAPGYPVKDYKFDMISYNETIYIDLSYGEESLSGKITPAAAGISVHLWSETTGVDALAYTVSDGSYTISGLFEGSDYEIMVIHPNYPPYYEADITIPAPGGVKNIDVSTGCTGDFSITGTVSGYGYENILVEAYSTSGRWNSDTTNENGQYEISCLTPGTYTVSINDYLNPQWKTVTIVNQSVQVNFSASEQQTYSIKGTISNLPLNEKAWINAWSLSTWMGNSVEITGTGEQPIPYQLDGLFPMSDYIVEITTLDFYGVYNGRSDWIFADMVDLSAGDKPGVNFTLPQQISRSSISGVISFPAGALKGDTVWVSAYSMSLWTWQEIEVILSQTASSQTDVPYTIAGLIPAEDYIVSVWSDKYKNCYYNGSENGTADWTQARMIDVKSSQKAENINFLLTTGETIKGQVIGKGNANLHVEAWSNSTGAWGETLTDASGNFVIGGLDRGTDYVVSVWDPVSGYVYYKTNDSVVWAWNQAAFVSTGATISIRLAEGGSISGVVFSSSGQPLKDIWVSAWSSTVFSGNGTYSDDKGNYEITGLPQGAEYIVSAEPQWYMSYVAQKKNNISCPGKVDFYLPIKETVYTISGTVKDTLGNPVADAAIEIWSFVSGYGKAKTNKEGVYTITGLMGGADYSLEVTPPAASNLAFESRSVNVPDDKYHFVLKPAKTFSGKATAPSGNPLKDVSISAYSESKNFWKQEMTGSDGTYLITGVPDASDFIITAEKSGHVTKELVNQSPGTLNFTLEFAGNITGTIVDKNTFIPIQNAVVQAKSGGTVLGTATTSDKGTYIIKNLPQLDDYELTASHALYPSKSKSPYQAGDTVDFQLEKGSSTEITGYVKSSSGSVISNANVVVEAFSKSGTPPTQKFEKSIPTDQNGKFILPGLTAAVTYYLKIQAWSLDQKNLLLDQWIGPDMIGLDNTGTIPLTAKEFKTSLAKNIEVRFSKQVTRSAELSVRLDIPGPVTGLRSTTHTSVLLAPASITARTVSNVKSGAMGKVSNNPYVTATWEPTAPNADEGYYAVFNQEGPETFWITKRNAPAEAPQRTRTITSGPLTGDDVQYYFHVAAVDDRGTIGQTSSIGFRIDTVAPKNGMVKAKANESTGETRNITLELGATGAYEVYISSTNYGENGKWEDFSVARQWKLPESNDTQKVFVQYRDQAGNTSNAVTTVNFNSLTEKDNLENAIRALQIISGIRLKDAYSGTDVFNDQRVNLHEVIFILQKAANLRN